jgi:hypothetical protein
LQAFGRLIKSVSRTVFGMATMSNIQDEDPENENQESMMVSDFNEVGL